MRVVGSCIWVDATRIGFHIIPACPLADTHFPELIFGSDFVQGAEIVVSSSYRYGFIAVIGSSRAVLEVALDCLDDYLGIFAERWHGHGMAAVDAASVEDGDFWAPFGFPFGTHTCDLQEQS